MQYAENGASSDSGVANPWLSFSNAISRIMGFSLLGSLLQVFIGISGGAEGGQNSYATDSVRLFLLGTIVEIGRRLFGWTFERFNFFQYSITAQFAEGDPVYEWIILLLTEEQIWTHSRHFRVSATSSIRQWTVDLTTDFKTKDRTDKRVEQHTECVPTYEECQLFLLKGYLAEVRRQGCPTGNSKGGQGQATGQLFLTLYTREMSALSAIVEDARQRYIKTNRRHVIVHTIDQAIYGPGSVWTSAKRKSRRPLNSIILQEGIISSLIEDAQEFIKMEDWYVKVGIPHRRGYLLYGPPGTGKSSTIYAVAGELGLEIYSLSLAASFVDDSFLARAVASIPKQAIFLLEDIDCAFPSREDDDMHGFGNITSPGGPGRRQATVTLSGLLNVLDGVGSEEGKIFFATTNYIERLDSALLHPGRIDKKFEYKLARKAQAAALFRRFYPEAYTTLLSEQEKSSDYEKKSNPLTSSEKTSALSALSEKFATSVPDHEFSTAEIQGFLLGYKQQPELAVQSISAWIKQESMERAERAKSEQEKKNKRREIKEEKETRHLQGGLARLGVAFGGPPSANLKSP